MSAQPASAKSRWALSTGLACLAVIAAVVTLRTGQVAPLALVVVTAMVLVARTHLGWRLGLAFAVLISLLGQLLFSWTAPHLGRSYGADEVALWTVVGVTCALFSAIPRTTGPRGQWTRRRALDLASALVVPFLFGAYFWHGAHRPGAPWIAWSMGGDSANNIIINRQFLSQGGLLLEQVNAAPLATVLHSSWGAIGVEDMGYAEQVRHLIVTSGQFSLLGWLLLSFLAATLTLSASPGGRGFRVLTAAAAASVPMLWFVAGHAMTFGFANAFPAMLVLVTGWICWLEHHRSPVASLTGQVLTTWLAATAWGPVAIVPALWMVATVIVERRLLWRAGRRLLWPAAAFVAATTYAVVVTLRDVGASSGALAADGGNPEISLRWSVTVGVALLVVTAAFYRQISPTVRIGVWTAVIASGLGAAYLIRARAGLPEWWGYYPIKFTWIVLSATFIVLIASLQHPARRLAHRGWGGTGTVLALGASVLVMAQISPPIQPVNLMSVLTPVSLHDGTTWDSTFKTMFTLMDTEPRSITAGYFEGPLGPQSDQLANFWMLQMSASSLGDPIRVPAYNMNAADPASVCATIAVWQGGVTVWTRDPALPDALDVACDPAYEFLVKVASADTAG